MAYNPTEEAADSYFKNKTIKQETWDAFQPDKAKALVQAQRELEIQVGYEAESPAATDIYRWDYAIFEHALNILLFQPRQHVSGKKKALSPIPSRGNSGGEDNSLVSVAAIAQIYLGLNRQIVERG